MDFREMLTETKSVSPLGGRRFRSLERVRFGHLSLSIQASETHYCEPRLTLPEGDYRYTRWEVAAFRGEGKNEAWINRDDPELEGLAALKHWEDGANGVGAYVPTEAVQELVDRFRELASQPA